MARFLRRFPFRNSSYKIDSVTTNLGEFHLLPRLTREFHENGTAYGADVHCSDLGTDRIWIVKKRKALVAWRSQDVYNVIQAVVLDRQSSLLMMRNFFWLLHSLECERMLMSPAGSHLYAIGEMYHNVFAFDLTDIS